MRVSDLAAFAIGNLRRRRLRTFLTVFGVVVGTGAIVLMVSLGVGLQEETLGLFNSVDFLTTVRVLPYDPQKGMMNFGRPLVPGTYAGFDDRAVAEIAAIPGVVAAYPALNIFSRMRLEQNWEGKPGQKDGGNVEFVGLPQAGIVPAYRKALLAGDFWAEENPDEKIAVIPSERLEDILPGPREDGKLVGTPDWKAALNSMVTISFTAVVEAPDAPPDPDKEIPTKKVTMKFRVVGVYDSQNFGLPWAPPVFIPLEQGKTLAKGRGGRPGEIEGGYPGIVCKVSEASKVEGVKKEIAKHGWGTMTVQDFLEALGFVFILLKAFLGAVSAIGLIVAFFGIANTMLMAILERTREIGLMKALGARGAEIRRMFVCEAASIGFFGAVFGIAGAWAIGQALNAIARWYVKKMHGPEDLSIFQVSPALALGAAAFAILVAVVAGLYPAHRASRLDPVQALRSL